MTKVHRRARRRAESRLFEAIEAADLGELRRAETLLDLAVVPRRARQTILVDERAAIHLMDPACLSIHSRSDSPPGCATRSI